MDSDAWEPSPAVDNSTPGTRNKFPIPNVDELVKMYFVMNDVACVPLVAGSASIQGGDDELLSALIPRVTKGPWNALAMENAIFFSFSKRKEKNL
jgi:hypothetical protein